ncbi:MAG: hypothetical protein INR73_24580 [Williamsia sp.]|nr:hypothetical protein [Williamsia sp.]
MMRTLTNLLALLLISTLLVHCKGKKTKLETGDAKTVADFIDFFSPATLPFQVTDSMLNKKETDSASIDYPAFTQFVPDSFLSKQFGKLKPMMYPLGKVSVKNAETYLFVKAVAPAKKVGYILAFDKEQRFVAGLALISSNKNSMPYQKGGMDKKYTVSQTFEQVGDDESVNELRNVYILNGEAHEFSKIVTDEGIANQVQDVINPLDTFPHTGKFSGDYIKDKRNFVSVRDGKNASTLLFFIHFEKNGGECTGELKGEASISGAKTAVYRANGNPCVLELNFSGNRVSLKEAEACGSYRGIKCFFEGSYSKKAEAPPARKKKKNPAH